MMVIKNIHFSILQIILKSIRWLVFSFVYEISFLRDFKSIFLFFVFFFYLKFILLYYRIVLKVEK